MKKRKQLLTLTMLSLLSSCACESNNHMEQVTLYLIDNLNRIEFKVDKDTTLKDILSLEVAGKRIIDLYSNEDLTIKADINKVINDGDSYYVFGQPLENLIGISTLDEFKAIKSDGNYYLANDIDCLNEVIDLGLEGTNAFKGFFNGNGFTIKNYRLPDKEYTSLFNESSGTICNLNVSINQTLESSLIRYASPLVSYLNNGLIRGCSSEGNLKITTSKDRGSVYLGGIAGRNENGNILLSRSECSLRNETNVDSYTGGIVGYNGGHKDLRTTVKYCYSLSEEIYSSSLNENCSSYAGGLVGFNFGTIFSSYSYNKNLTSRSKHYQNFAGGLVGDNNGGKVFDSFSLSNVNAINENGNIYLGNVVGRNFKASKYEESGKTYNLFGYDSQIIKGQISNQSSTIEKLNYPSLTKNELENEKIYAKLGLKDVFITSSSSLPRFNMVITSIPEVKEFTFISSINDFNKMNENPYGNFKLSNDLTLNKDEFKVIGTYLKPFRGIFDGNDKTIRFEISKEDNLGYTGLFGYLNGIVRNLNLESTLNIKATQSKTTFGSLAGYALKSAINNVNVKTNINIEGNNVTLGGLVGINDSGFIEETKIIGDINSTSSKGESYIGGLSGINKGTILRSSTEVNLENNGSDNIFVGGMNGKNLYEVKSSYSINSINVSNIKELKNVGGLNGANFSLGLVENSYVKSNIANLKEAKINLIGGFTGDNLASIKNSYYFVNDEIKYSAGESLEFTDIKRVTLDELKTLSSKLSDEFYDSNDGYPRLKFEEAK